MKTFPYDATLVGIFAAVCLCIVSIKHKSHPNDAIHSEGFWIPHTANVIWCEENYGVTFYAAEFVNAMTNLPIICAIIFALQNWSKRNLFVTMTIYALLAVALSSFFFHLTLKRLPQLMDQISMLVYMICVSICFIKYKAAQIQAYQKFTFSLVGWSVILMFIFPGTSWIFHCSFVGLCVQALFSFRKVYIDNLSNPNFILSCKHALWSLNVGMFFWILDRGYCNRLPVQVQAHAIWHLTTFYTAFQFLQIQHFITSEDKIEFRKLCGFFPMVRNLSKKKSA